jgi:hypothetical protein
LELFLRNEKLNNHLNSGVFENRRKFFGFVKTLFFVFTLLFFFGEFAYAKIGVGVGTGKIQVDQSLKAGLIYTLPSLVVLNTGDEVSEYSVSVKHRENQTELKAPEGWFKFKPEKFILDPGKSQSVEIKLYLPVKGAAPGDYFVFLSASPESKTDVKGTSLGIAAAAKLYFTVAPANFFTGIYYRIISILSGYSPWSYIFLIATIFILFLIVIRKYFSFEIDFNVKKKK